MTKKIAYINEIYSSLQKMHCPAVPKRMTAYPLWYQIRGYFFLAKFA